MKFTCVEADEGRLTAGKIYHGQIILKSETRENVHPSWTHHLRIVVYDDRGEWGQYFASKFKPAAE
jgi:hypothetical protein